MFIPIYKKPVNVNLRAFKLRRYPEALGGTYNLVKQGLNAPAVGLEPTT